MFKFKFTDIWRIVSKIFSQITEFKFTFFRTLGTIYPALRHRCHKRTNGEGNSYSWTGSSPVCPILMDKIKMSDWIWLGNLAWLPALWAVCMGRTSSPSSFWQGCESDPFSAGSGSGKSEIRKKASSDIFYVDFFI